MTKEQYEQAKIDFWEQYGLNGEVSEVSGEHDNAGGDAGDFEI